MELRPTGAILLHQTNKAGSMIGAWCGMGGQRFRVACVDYRRIKDGGALVEIQW